MDAKELRIGNWVDLGILGFVRMAKIDPKEPMFAMPIPLSPEIFEKCGFRIHEKKYSEIWIEKDGEGRWEYLYLINDGLRIGESITHYLTTNTFTSGDIVVKYLHQLQNLYFVLTGEELPIDL